MIGLFFLLPAFLCYCFATSIGCLLYPTASGSDAPGQSPGKDVFVKHVIVLVFTVAGMAAAVLEKSSFSDLSLQFLFGFGAEYPAFLDANINGLFGKYFRAALRNLPVTGFSLDSSEFRSTNFVQESRWVSLNPLVTVFFGLISPFSLLLFAGMVVPSLATKRVGSRTISTARKFLVEHITFDVQPTLLVLQWFFTVFCFSSFSMVVQSLFVLSRFSSFYSVGFSVTSAGFWTIVSLTSALWAISYLSRYLKLVQIMDTCGEAVDFHSKPVILLSAYYADFRTMFMFGEYFPMEEVLKIAKFSENFNAGRNFRDEIMLGACDGFGSSSVGTSDAPRVNYELGSDLNPEGYCYKLLFVNEMDLGAFPFVKVVRNAMKESEIDSVKDLAIKFVDEKVHHVVREEGSSVSISDLEAIPDDHVLGATLRSLGEGYCHRKLFSPSDWINKAYPTVDEIVSHCENLGICSFIGFKIVPSGRLGQSDLFHVVSTNSSSQILFVDELKELMGPRGVLGGWKAGSCQKTKKQKASAQKLRRKRYAHKEGASRSNKSICSIPQMSFYRAPVVVDKTEYGTGQDVVFASRALLPKPSTSKVVCSNVVRAWRRASSNGRGGSKVKRKANLVTSYLIGESASPVIASLNSGLSSGAKPPLSPPPSSKMASIKGGVRKASTRILSEKDFEGVDLAVAKRRFRNYEIKSAHGFLWKTGLYDGISPATAKILKIKVDELDASKRPVITEASVKAEWMNFVCGDSPNCVDTIGGHPARKDLAQPVSLESLRNSCRELNWESGDSTHVADSTVVGGSEREGSVVPHSVVVDKCTQGSHEPVVESSTTNRSVTTQLGVGYSSNNAGDGPDCVTVLLILYWIFSGGEAAAANNCRTPAEATPQVDLTPELADSGSRFHTAEGVDGFSWVIPDERRSLFERGCVGCEENTNGSLSLDTILQDGYKLSDVLDFVGVFSSTFSKALTFALSSGEYSHVMSPSDGYSGFEMQVTGTFCSDGVGNGSKTVDLYLTIGLEPPTALALSINTEFSFTHRKNTIRPIERQPPLAHYEWVTLPSPYASCTFKSVGYSRNTYGTPTEPHAFYSEAANRRGFPAFSDLTYWSTRGETFFSDLFYSMSSWNITGGSLYEKTDAWLIFQGINAQTCDWLTMAEQLDSDPELCSFSIYGVSEFIRADTNSGSEVHPEYNRKRLKTAGKSGYRVSTGSQLGPEYSSNNAGDGPGMNSLPMQKGVEYSSNNAGDGPVFGWPVTITESATPAKGDHCVEAEAISEVTPSTVGSEPNQMVCYAESSYAGGCWKMLFERGFMDGPEFMKGSTLRRIMFQFADRLSNDTFSISYVWTPNLGVVGHIRKSLHGSYPWELTIENALYGGTCQSTRGARQNLTETRVRNMLVEDRIKGMVKIAISGDSTMYLLETSGDKVVNVTKASRSLHTHVRRMVGAQPGNLGLCNGYLKDAIYVAILPDGAKTTLEVQDGRIVSLGASQASLGLSIPRGSSATDVPRSVSGSLHARSDAVSRSVGPKAESVFSTDDLCATGSLYSSSELCFTMRTDTSEECRYRQGQCWRLLFTKESTEGEPKVYPNLRWVSEVMKGRLSGHTSGLSLNYTETGGIIHLFIDEVGCKPKELLKKINYRFVDSVLIGATPLGSGAAGETRGYVVNLTNGGDANCEDKIEVDAGIDYISIGDFTKEPKASEIAMLSTLEFTDSDSGSSVSLPSLRESMGVLEEASTLNRFSFGEMGEIATNSELKRNGWIPGEDFSEQIPTPVEGCPCGRCDKVRSAGIIAVATELDIVDRLALYRVDLNRYVVVSDQMIKGIMLIEGRVVYLIRAMAEWPGLDEKAYPCEVDAEVLRVLPLMVPDPDDYVAWGSPTELGSKSPDVLGLFSTSGQYIDWALKALSIGDGEHEDRLSECKPTSEVDIGPRTTVINTAPVNPEARRGSVVAGFCWRSLFVTGSIPRLGLFPFVEDLLAYVGDAGEWSVAISRHKKTFHVSKEMYRGVNYMVMPCSSAIEFMSTFKGFKVGAGAEEITVSKWISRSGIPSPCFFVSEESEDVVAVGRTDDNPVARSPSFRACGIIVVYGDLYLFFRVSISVSGSGRFYPGEFPCSGHKLVNTNFFASKRVFDGLLKVTADELISSFLSFLGLQPGALSMEIEEKLGSSLVGRGFDHEPFDDRRYSFSESSLSSATREFIHEARNDYTEPGYCWRLLFDGGCAPILGSYPSLAQVAYVGNFSNMDVYVYETSAGHSLHGPRKFLHVSLEKPSVSLYWGGKPSKIIEELLARYSGRASEVVLGADLESILRKVGDSELGFLTPNEVEYNDAGEILSAKTHVLSIPGIRLSLSMGSFLPWAESVEDDSIIRFADRTLVKSNLLSAKTDDVDCAVDHAAKLESVIGTTCSIAEATTLFCFAKTLLGMGIEFRPSDIPSSGLGIVYDLCFVLTLCCYSCGKEIGLTNGLVGLSSSEQYEPTDFRGPIESWDRTIVKAFLALSEEVLPAKRMGLREALLFCCVPNYLLVCVDSTGITPCELHGGQLPCHCGYVNKAPGIHTMAVHDHSSFHKRRTLVCNCHMKCVSCLETTCGCRHDMMIISYKGITSTDGPGHPSHIRSMESIKRYSFTFHVDLSRPESTEHNVQIFSDHQDRKDSTRNVELAMEEAMDGNVRVSTQGAGRLPDVSGVGESGSTLLDSLLEFFSGNRSNLALSFDQTDETLKDISRSRAVHDKRTDREANSNVSSASSSHKISRNFVANVPLGLPVDALLKHPVGEEILYWIDTVFPQMRYSSSTVFRFDGFRFYLEPTSSLAVSLLTLMPREALRYIVIKQDLSKAESLRRTFGSLDELRMRFILASNRISMDWREKVLPKLPKGARVEQMFGDFVHSDLFRSCTFPLTNDPTVEESTMWFRAATTLATVPAIWFLYGHLSTWLLPSLLHYLPFGRKEETFATYLALWTRKVVAISSSSAQAVAFSLGMLAVFNLPMALISVGAFAVSLVLTQVTVSVDSSNALVGVLWLVTGGYTGVWLSMIMGFERKTDDTDFGRFMGVMRTSRKRKKFVGSASSKFKYSILMAIACGITFSFVFGTCKITDLACTINKLDTMASWSNLFYMVLFGVAYVSPVEVVFMHACVWLNSDLRALIALSSSNVSEAMADPSNPIRVMAGTYGDAMTCGFMESLDDCIVRQMQVQTFVLLYVSVGCMIWKLYSDPGYIKRQMILASIGMFLFHFVVWPLWTGNASIFAGVISTLVSVITGGGKGVFTVEAQEKIKFFRDLLGETSFGSAFVEPPSPWWPFFNIVICMSFMAVAIPGLLFFAKVAIKMKAPGTYNAEQTDTASNSKRTVLSAIFSAYNLLYKRGDVICNKMIRLIKSQPKKLDPGELYVFDSKDLADDSSVKQLVTYQRNVDGEPVFYSTYHGMAGVDITVSMQDAMELGIEFGVYKQVYADPVTDIVAWGGTPTFVKHVEREICFFAGPEGDMRIGAVGRVSVDTPEGAREVVRAITIDMEMGCSGGPIFCSRGLLGIVGSHEALSGLDGTTSEKIDSNGISRFNAASWLPSAPNTTPDDVFENLSKAVLGTCNVLNLGTGTGKTTTFPVKLAQAGRKVIVATPRRAAAAGCFNRIQQLTNLPVGARFDSKSYGFDNAAINVVTTASLAHSLVKQSDFLGLGRDICLDEVHDTSPETRVLERYLKKFVSAPNSSLRGYLVTATPHGTSMHDYSSLEGREVLMRERTYECSHKKFITEVEDKIMKEIETSVGKQNILVFVHSKAACKRLSERAAKLHPSGHIYKFDGPVPTSPLVTGAVTSDNVARAMTCLNDIYKRGTGAHQKYVIVATECLDTGVTFPFDHVVISGLRVANEFNGDSYELNVTNISAQSFIQQRGRVGRITKGICTYFVRKDCEFVSNIEPDSGQSDYLECWTKALGETVPYGADPEFFAQLGASSRAANLLLTPWHPRVAVHLTDEFGLIYPEILSKLKLNFEIYGNLNFTRLKPSNKKFGGVANWPLRRGKLTCSGETQTATYRFPIGLNTWDPVLRRLILVEEEGEAEEEIGVGKRTTEERNSKKGRGKGRKKTSGPSIEEKILAAVGYDWQMQVDSAKEFGRSVEQTIRGIAENLKDGLNMPDADLCFAVLKDYYERHCDDAPYRHPVDIIREIEFSSVSMGMAIWLGYIVLLLFGGSFWGPSLSFMSSTIPMLFIAFMYDQRVLFENDKSPKVYGLYNKRNINNMADNTTWQTEVQELWKSCFDFLPGLWNFGYTDCSRFEEIEPSMSDDESDSGSGVISEKLETRPKDPVANGFLPPYNHWCTNENMGPYVQKFETNDYLHPTVSGQLFSRLKDYFTLSEVYKSRSDVLYVWGFIPVRKESYDQWGSWQKAFFDLAAPKGDDPNVRAEFRKYASKYTSVTGDLNAQALDAFYYVMTSFVMLFMFFSSIAMTFGATYFAGWVTNPMGVGFYASSTFVGAVVTLLKFGSEATDAGIKEGLKEVTREGAPSPVRRTSAFSSMAVDGLSLWLMLNLTGRVNKGRIWMREQLGMSDYSQNRMSLDYASANIFRYNAGDLSAPRFKSNPYEISIPAVLISAAINPLACGVMLASAMSIPVRRGKFAVETAEGVFSAWDPINLAWWFAFCYMPVLAVTNGYFGVAVFNLFGASIMKQYVEDDSKDGSIWALIFGSITFTRFASSGVMHTSGKVDPSRYAGNGSIGQSRKAPETKSVSFGRAEFEDGSTEDISVGSESENVESWGGVAVLSGVVRTSPPSQSSFLSRTLRLPWLFNKVKSITPGRGVDLNPRGEQPQTRPVVDIPGRRGSQDRRPMRARKGTGPTFHKTTTVPIPEEESMVCPEDFKADGVRKVYKFYSSKDTVALLEGGYDRAQTDPPVNPGNAKFYGSVRPIDRVPVPASYPVLPAPDGLVEAASFHRMRALKFKSKTLVCDISGVDTSFVGGMYNYYGGQFKLSCILDGRSSSEVMAPKGLEVVNRVWNPMCDKIPCRGDLYVWRGSNVVKDTESQATLLRNLLAGRNFKRGGSMLVKCPYFFDAESLEVLTHAAYNFEEVFALKIPDSRDNDPTCWLMFKEFKIDVVLTSRRDFFHMLEDSRRELYVDTALGNTDRFVVGMNQFMLKEFLPKAVQRKVVVHSQEVVKRLSGRLSNPSIEDYAEPKFAKALRECEKHSILPNKRLRECWDEIFGAGVKDTSIDYLLEGGRTFGERRRDYIGSLPVCAVMSTSESGGSETKSTISHVREILDSIHGNSDELVGSVSFASLSPRLTTQGMIARMGKFNPGVDFKTYSHLWKAAKFMKDYIYKRCLSKRRKPYTLKDTEWAMQYVNKKASLSQIENHRYRCKLGEAMENEEFLEEVEKHIDEYTRPSNETAEIPVSYCLFPKEEKRFLKEKHIYEGQGIPRIISMHCGSMRVAEARLFGEFTHDIFQNTDQRPLPFVTNGMPRHKVSKRVHAQMERAERRHGKGNFLGMTGDFSTWDATMNMWVQLLEYYCIRDLYDEPSQRALARFFKQDMFKQVINTEGDIVWVSGQRASGAWNTSSGNGIGNIILEVARGMAALDCSAAEVFERLDISVEGDDCNVVGSREDVEKFYNAETTLKRCGIKFAPEDQILHDCPENCGYLSHGYTRCVDPEGNVSYWGFRSLKIILARLAVVKRCRNRYVRDIYKDEVQPDGTVVKRFKEGYPTLFKSMLISSLLDYWPIMEVRAVCLKALLEIGAHTNEEIKPMWHWRHQLNPRKPTSLEGLCKTLSEIHGEVVTVGALASSKCDEQLYDGYPYPVQKSSWIDLYKADLESGLLFMETGSSAIEEASPHMSNHVLKWDDADVSGGGGSVVEPAGYGVVHTATKSFGARQRQKLRRRGFKNISHTIIGQDNFGDTMEFVKRPFESDPYVDARAALLYALEQLREDTEWSLRHPWTFFRSLMVKREIEFVMVDLLPDEFK